MKNVIIGSMLLLSCSVGGQDGESVVADTIVTADTTIVADTAVVDTAKTDTIVPEVK